MSGTSLGIAGVGLIGGSIALRARSSQARIIGYDRDPAVLTQALARGMIDAAAADLESLARESETLIIALPLDATVSALETLADRPGPRLTIDVASMKAPLVAAGSRVASYVGSHPMAGREAAGLAAADAGLFENATWAYTPRADARLIRAIRAFIAAMGALPLEIEAGDHDEIVALTSHLPQTLSVLLGDHLARAAQADRRVLELCGPGMRSMLRLARSSPSMWSPIVAANAAPLAAQLRALGAVIDRVATALETGESGPLMSYFESARTSAVALEERFAPPGRSSAYRSPQQH